MKTKGKNYFPPEESFSHLRYLLPIKEEGSISAAANKTGLDRSTIRYYLKSLRIRAEDRLLWWDSKARITRWTEVGQIYLQLARDQKENLQDLKDFELIGGLRKKHKRCNAQITQSAILLLHEITYKTTHNLFPNENPRLFMCKRCCLRFAVPDTPEIRLWISEHPDYFLGPNPIFLTIPMPSNTGT